MFIIPNFSIIFSFFFICFEFFKHKLLILFIIPLFGIFILFFKKNISVTNLKLYGLQVSFFTFLWSLYIFFDFDVTIVNFQDIVKINFLYFGIDGVSNIFILLTTFLIFICIMLGLDKNKNELKLYILCFLILDLTLVVLFSVLNLVFFYVFFEIVLIPMFLVINWFGSRERKIRASYMFFLYTFFGSILMLTGILYIYFITGSTDFFIIWNINFTFFQQKVLWFLFFISFAVKIPMIPFHIWLPEAHVEAPTAGSVLLAGILLKLGGYGIFRIILPIMPEATYYYMPLIFTLCVIGIIYSSLTTMVQIDLKKVIAYSSVAHMNVVVLGMFSLTLIGIQGSFVLMISHGIVSSALFICVGILYDRFHTRIIKYYSGIVTLMPLFIIFFFIFTLANMGVPGTSSFIGEILILIGIFVESKFAAMLASLGIVLSAGYSIWLYNRVSFGKLKINYISDYIDITRKEFFILIIFCFFTFFLGVYPVVLFNQFYIPIFKILFCFFLIYKNV